jgi:oligopeptidase B
MKRLPFVLLVLAAFSSCKQKTMDRKPYTWPNATPPFAEKKPFVRTIHGDSVTDNYYWMIDYFKKGPDSAKVIDYLAAENKYLDVMMGGTKKLQSDLFAEMKGRIKEEDESAPVFRNGYFYYTRTEEGKEYFKYCRRKESLSAPEEVLLDVDQLATGHAYYSVTGFNVSPDNKLLAYGVDDVSRRQYTIYIKNLETGELYKDTIKGTSGGSVWANDNKTLFYTWNNPETLLTEKIKRHKLGSAASADVTVYTENDHSNYIGVSKAKSGKYLFIYSGATLSSEMRMLNADTPDGEFEVFQPRMKDVLYEVVALDDMFLILTNWKARNFRLMKCPLDATGFDNWTDVISPREKVLLEEVEEFRNFIVVSERAEGLVKFRIHNIGSGTEHYVDFGESAYTAGIGNNPDYNSSKLRYQFTSLKTPASTYDYSMDTREKTLVKQQEVVGGYEAKNYVTERQYAPAADGTKIPISIVYKEGTPLNGTAPLLLYAYGSYGISSDPSFNSNRLSLLDRGFIFAIAHVRGGQEMGREWYDNGKMMHKKNTFTDFIDVAKYLIDQEYTSKEHLYAQGGSAGGLLMGAVANMEPGLWHGIVAQVPFVDVVNTMLDESIPLTTNEFDEWGNPKNKEAYLYMKSYSPYEDIEKKAYPNMLVTTGLHDSQVQYFEPAKWVARLRDMKTDKNVLLLHTNMDFGHGGASGRFDYLKDVSLVYAFLFALEGINK